MKSVKKDKEFYLASLLMISTGILDCYLTSKGLKDGVAIEGNLYYGFLYDLFEQKGIYLGKVLLLSPLISICNRNKNTLSINIASLANSIGAGSWTLSYALQS